MQMQPKNGSLQVIRYLTPFMSMIDKFNFKWATGNLFIGASRPSEEELAN